MPATILRLALPSPLRRLFDYLAPQGVPHAALQPGVRLRVPFGRREVVGVLVEVAHPAPGSALALRTAAQEPLWHQTSRRMAVAPLHTKRGPQAPGTATQPKRQE